MTIKTNLYGLSTNYQQSKSNVIINNFSQSSQLDSIFQKYDLDKNGRLSEDEMKLLMKDYNIDSSSNNQSKGSNVWDALGGLFSGIGNALPMGLMALLNKGEGGGDTDAS